MPQTNNPRFQGLRSSQGSPGIHERHGVHREPLGVHTLEDLHKRVNLLEDIFRAGISFGVPLSFNSLGGASGMRLGNMRGGWVHQVVTSLGTQVTFSHFLNLANPTGLLNVRWFIAGIQHNGTGAGAGDTISLIYQGGMITSDSVQLVATAAGARTVDSSNPLTLDVFFIPADG